MATPAPHSPPRPRRSLRGLGRGALFSVWTLPGGRGRGPAAWRPPLVFGWSRVGLGGGGLSLGELLFFLPAADGVGLLFFRRLRRGRRRLSTRPLTNLRVAGFSQFLGTDAMLGLRTQKDTSTCVRVSSLLLSEPSFQQVLDSTLGSAITGKSS